MVECAGSDTIHNTDGGAFSALVATLRDYWKQRPLVFLPEERPAGGSSSFAQHCSYKRRVFWFGAAPPPRDLTTASDTLWLNGAQLVSVAFEHHEKHQNERNASNASTELTGFLGYSHRIAQVGRNFPTWDDHRFMFCPPDFRKFKYPPHCYSQVPLRFPYPL